jgi:hypothetical protein
VTTGEQARLKALERENRELRDLGRYEVRGARASPNPTGPLADDLLAFARGE